MLTKLKLLSLPFLLLFTACNSSKGYDEVETLYKESVEVLQSKDKEKMEAFVMKIIPDEGTISYMNENECVYRGFPVRLSEYPEYNYADSARSFYSNELYRYASRLDEKGLLKDLKYVSLDRPVRSDSLTECGCPEILFTEPFGICVSGQDTIQYKLGELLLVNGKWKTFTDFKLW